MIAFANLNPLGLHIEVLVQIFDHCIEIFDGIVNMMKIFKHKPSTLMRFIPTRERFATVSTKADILERGSSIIKILDQQNNEKSQLREL
jgi:hypothetical protein